jgi:hypothetical protein
MIFNKVDLCCAVLIAAIIAFCLRRHWLADRKKAALSSSIGVRDLVEKVRSELAETEQARLDRRAPSVFQLKDFDLEVKFVIKEEMKQAGKIEYSVITVDNETSYSAEKVQTIKLHMSVMPPVKEEAGADSYDPTLANKATTIGPVPKESTQK